VHQKQQVMTTPRQQHLLSTGVDGYCRTSHACASSLRAVDSYLLLIAPAVRVVLAA
jgi:hypothetical protein